MLLKGICFLQRVKQKSEKKCFPGNFLKNLLLHLPSQKSRYSLIASFL